MEKQKSSKNTPNQQTREKIVNALLTLIKEKPLSTITITELTQLAGVSRMAFYRNFSTKEEVFSSHLKDILQKYQEEDRKQNLQGIYYDRAHMIHCFEYWYQYRDFFEGLIHCGFGNIFLEYLTRYIIWKWKSTCQDASQYYRLSAFAGALYNVYFSWAYNGYQETPQQLAQILNVPCTEQPPCRWQPAR